MRVQNLRGRAGEGRAPDQTAKQNRSERIDIGAARHLTAAGALFRRHKCRRPDCAAFIGQLRHVQRAGDAKVGEEWSHRLIG